MKKLLLGIDIGTSSCKLAVFRENGEVVATASEQYAVYYPKKGWVEQNPEDWWKAVCKALKKIFKEGKVEKEQIAGIGIDGQGWSAIAIDHIGRVLGRTPIWMDTRANEICEKINETELKDSIFELCGNELRPTYATAKILWYKKERPELYKKIHKILQSNSFIAYRLTGVIKQDISQAYAYHFFNMKEGTWDKAMCKKLKIPMKFLPEIVPCHQVIGTVTIAASRKTGLLPGIPVVIGGLDAACGALGAGVIHAGETQEQGGQAGGMSICLDRYQAEKNLILGYHVVPGKWLLQGGTTGGGGVMRWVEQQFAAYERTREEETGKSSFMQLNELADEVEPGCDGVVFLPYMAGERSPIWNANAKGVFYGLDFTKTKGHMVRAAMEGVAYALKHNLDVAEKAGVKVKRLAAMGGSANSVLWTQMKADITGKPIVVPSSDTATTLGAAILAGVGVGIYKDFDEAVNMTVKIKKKYEPNVKDEETYGRNYQTYLALYENLKELMDQNGGMSNESRSRTCKRRYSV